MNVALIPTGKLEHQALGEALGRLFPDHVFIAYPPDSNLNGFTSRNVAPFATGVAGPVSSELDDLAQTLVEAIFRRKGREPRFDFAFAIEDLELANDHQAPLVLQLFREAADRYVQATQTAPRANQVRERCSFHLLRPMIEAYFFGEQAALVRAGAQQLPQLPANLDLEQFSTTDAGYLGLAGGTPRIADPPMRARHPKAYLRYLCDPTLLDRNRQYRETKGGARALLTLDWQQVLSTPPHCPFLHALLSDLAEALSAPLPFVDQAHASPLTRFPGPANRVLRNL